MLTQRDLKGELADLIERSAHLGAADIRRLFSDAMREWEEEQGWDQFNSRQPWPEGQLRAVLSDAPTVDNCIKYAKAFGRSYGSIELIYRWAATSDKDVEMRGRADDSFVQQVRRVAKELGWRA